MIGFLNIYIPTKFLPKKMTARPDFLGNILCSCFIEDFQRQYKNQFLSSEFQVHSIQPLGVKTQTQIEQHEISEELVQYIKDYINGEIAESIMTRRELEALY